jgi:hypothetical protein
MKKTKLPGELAENASRLHRYIGELLTSEESNFKNFEIRQEYRVSLVNPEFKSNREKFDWVILGLNVVIEVHGKQHQAPVCFGGITKDVAEINFINRLKLDELKMKTAEVAGWAYVVVWYYEHEITLEELTQRIFKALMKTNKTKWPKSKKIQGRKFNGEKTGKNRTL